MLHDDLGLRDVKGRRPDLRLVLLYVTGIGSDQIGLVAADNRTRSNHRYKFRAIGASDVLVMTTLLLHSFMRSSQAESIIAAVSCDWRSEEDDRQVATYPQLCSTNRLEDSNTRKFDLGLSFPAKSATLAGRCRPGSVQLSAQDCS